MRVLTTAPLTIAQLSQRVEAIAGLTLKQVAERCAVPVPENLRYTKGWIGQLLEIALGADAGCEARPDFTHLHIELKTIPVDQQGKPQETTFISHAPLLNSGYLTWQQSDVYQKLQHVLWIPIESPKAIPLSERRIGAGFLWRPNAEEEALLRQDWEELMAMITLGQLEKITAKLGKVLQIRPKAANSRSLCWGISETGEKIQTLPRGFYLRTQFTHAILQRNFNL
jgi:DNA mismatch repair protein MutH